MNLGEMRDRVALTLDNLPTSDPWYDQIDSFLNRSGNAFIRMRVGRASYDLFPELQNSWTIGPTYPLDGTIIVDANTVARPSDCLVVQEVVRAESATLPDWTATQELPVRYVDWVEFGRLSKESSTAGYAKIFTRKGNSVKIWPSITSTYTDYLRFYGLKAESTLSLDADTFFMDAHWHDPVCVLAAHHLALRMGNTDTAGLLLSQIQQELGQTSDVTALQQDSTYLEVLEAPNSATVYGWPLG